MISIAAVVLVISFSIITGYELRKGRVLSRDRTPGGDRQSKQFVNYEPYNGNDEDAFTENVWASISVG